MNFIETIFESLQKVVDISVGKRPYDILTFCIGSGSNFEIHTNISLKQADEIYSKMLKKLPLGKREEIKDVGSAKMEKWNCLESQSGYTYTFIFKIDKVIYHDPNDVIDEWRKLNK